MRQRSLLPVTSHVALHRKGREEGKLGKCVEWKLSKGRWRKEAKAATPAAPRDLISPDDDDDDDEEWPKEIFREEIHSRGNAERRRVNHTSIVNSGEGGGGFTLTSATSSVPCVDRALF